MLLKQIYRLLFTFVSANNQIGRYSHYTNHLFIEPVAPHNIPSNWLREGLLNSVFLIIHYFTFRLLI